jgi:hypothetical protein
MSTLKQFEMQEVGIVHLRDANDAPMYATGADGKADLSKPIRVHVYGPGSKQYARAMSAKAARWLKHRERKGKADQTAEEKALDQTEFLVACTKEIENAESDTGATGAAFYAEVYSNEKLSFIATQVAAYMNETANFTGGSTTN